MRSIPGRRRLLLHLPAQLHAACKRRGNLPGRQHSTRVSLRRRCRMHGVQRQRSASRPHAQIQRRERSNLNARLSHAIGRREQAQALVGHAESGRVQANRGRVLNSADSLRQRSRRPGDEHSVDFDSC